MHQLNEAEIIEACKVLFGDEVHINRLFLNYIQPSGVKSAFRKKALDTHPDRFVMLGEEYVKECTSLFREVTQAYEKLNSFLKLREHGVELLHTHQGHPPPSFKKGESSAAKKRNTYSAGDSFKNSRYTKRDPRVFQHDKVPGKPLRIGEFLYYSGKISWQHLISAIVWQSKHRIRLGGVASNWGWVSENRIKELLKERQRGERLGDILLRYNLVTPFQLSVLLWHQQKTQRPLGEFFVHEAGLFSEAALERYLNSLREHNKKHDK